MIDRIGEHRQGYFVPDARFAPLEELHFPPGFVGVAIGHWPRCRPLSCTVLVKPIIRVGLFSVTMVRGAFACATHGGLLAGVPCTILVKPIIRVGLFSVTMVRGAFACATHDGLLAGVLASNSDYLRLPPLYG